jgi:hypothetical protein
VLGVFLVCKRSLRDFLEVFLVLKVHYEGIKVCDASVCTILRFLCCCSVYFSISGCFR